MITHRVTAKGINGDEFIRENFEMSTDAETYYGELQKDGSDIDAMLDIYPAITITLEEMHLGEWIIKSRKLIRK